MPPTGAASVALGALLGVAALAGADAYGIKLDQHALTMIIAMLAGLCGVLMSLAPAAPTKAGALPDCPATSWPAGKPMLASPSDYPTYDHANDPKGSFMKICDMMIADVKDELPKMYALPARENEWIEKMLQYNTKGGKMTRGIMVVETAAILFKARGMPVDNTTMCKFAVLGWCIEWLQAWLLVADDMMDESVTRRGQPCWYKSMTDKGNPVGSIAINDAVTIEALVFKVLKRHFAKDDCYMQLVDLMMETTFQTELGQLLDTMCDNLEISEFSLDRWTAIVTYKTAYALRALPPRTPPTEALAVLAGGPAGGPAAVRLRAGGPAASAAARARCLPHPPWRAPRARLTQQRARRPRPHAGAASTRSTSPSRLRWCTPASPTRPRTTARGRS